METVSVETISEIGNSNNCQKNPELSDKQKKRSGKKKRKSRKQESELKNNDSHNSSQNGQADGAFSSEEKKQGETGKSTSEDYVQLSENCVSTLPAATLHHTDPVLSTREYSIPDTNRNDSGRRKSKKRDKKKKEDDFSCEEKMLDDAEKITNEDQVHPPNTPLSNGIIQEGSSEHTQDSCEMPGAAQICTGPNLSAQEDSQPDATSMTCSQKRKREKKRDKNALKESDVDIHSTNAEVAVKYNTITEAEGSKSMSKEENSVASVMINSCLKSKDDKVEQQECTDVKLSETVAQTQSPKAKKRKKRKAKTVEACDPLGNTLPISTKSGPVECVENNDGNKETDGNTEVKEDVLEAKYDIISEAEGSKSMSKEEKSVASVVISSCLKSKDDTVEQQECTDVKLSDTVAQTQSPKAKKRKKRKAKTVEACDPLGNTLPISTKSGPVECVENNDGNKETDGNTEVKEDVLEAKYNTASETEGSKSMSKEDKSVTSVVISSCLISKDDTVEQQECTDVKLSETVAQTQSPKAKKRKKRKTKTVEVCDPLGNTLPTSTKSGPVECVENNNGNKEADENTEVKEDVLEVKYNTISEAEGSKMMSIEEKSIASVVISSCLKSKDGTVEQQECTDVKLSETVAQTQSPKAKKRKKRKTKTVEVCDPLGNTLPTTTKSGPVECVENNNGNKETDENTEVKEDVLEVKCNTISEAEGSKMMSIEEKSISSVVISSCLKSKDATVEQQECTDVKLNETVPQTQNPKAKRRKKRKTETMEVCDPLGNTLSTSMKSGPVECGENSDGNGGRELISYLASEKANSVTGEEHGFQYLGKTEEKETDENTEVKEDVLGAGVCDVRSKKRKGKKKKTSSADHKTADMEVCEPSGSVECLLDHSNEKVMQNCDGNARQEFGEEDMTNKIEKSAMREKSGVLKSGKRKEMTKDENIESNQDALGAEGVSDVGRKRQKRTRSKNTNCDSVATMDSESVQCLLYHSNREGVKKCDGNADEEIASKNLASKIEDSATKGESVEDVEITNKKKKDKKGEVDQDALGAEGVNKVEVKKKNSLDHKTDNMEEDSKIKNDKKGEVDQNALGAEGVCKVEVIRKKNKKKENSFDHTTDDMKEKDDASLTRNDEEPELDREKLETSLSCPVLIQDNVAQGVASSETGDVPRCLCQGQRTRKLVIFDLNGILADIVQGFTGQFVPDGKVSYRSVFRRPFLPRFLDFCFQRFNVAIWSSRRVGLNFMINIVMQNYARNLLFCFDQNNCTTTKFKTQEKNDKPLFLKDLRRVWDRFGTCISCGKRKYDETNTLLVDDSPDKALCNPPHTGIFPYSYQYTDCQDSALGPEGELRKYLERLADAENVQKFVAENPFGQTAITETHESWEFYSKVIEEHK